MQKIEKFIYNFAEKFDNYFLKLLPSNYYSPKLHDAMEYSISVGGKRLRPLFLLEISRMLGVKKNGLKSCSSHRVNPLLFISS